MFLMLDSQAAQISLEIKWKAFVSFVVSIFFVLPKLIIKIMEKVQGGKHFSEYDFTQYCESQNCY